MRVHGAGTGPQRAARARVPKALHDCGVPRTDVCSHGREKGGSAASLVSIAMFLTQSTVPARSARPSLHPASVRRRAEARRRAASQRHGPWPMADRLGKAWKGPSCRQKGLRQATYYEHTQTCTCGHVCVVLCFFVAVLMCLCVCWTSVCFWLPFFVWLFVCSFVRLFCVFACSVICAFVCCIRVRASACALLSWAEQ